MNLNDPHYNESGIYCNVRVEIDNTHHREWIRKPCHSKSTVHNIVFLPKAMIYHRKNGNVLRGFVLLSFDHMSRGILFFPVISIRIWLHGILIGKVQFAGI